MALSAKAVARSFIQDNVNVVSFNDAQLVEDNNNTTRLVNAAKKNGKKRKSRCREKVGR